MRLGIPLTDDDRRPWLDRVARVLAIEALVVVGCSALRRAYRDQLRAGAGGPVRFFHLTGSREVIADRMAARSGHYKPPGPLDSQFAALEILGPDEALAIDIDQPLDAIINAAAEGLKP